ncbi:tetratricopeptide repeat protein [Bacteroides sp. 224]|uniref:tetratricopeptide repeat protein n=1 Tax=Bacteroides sp. 224 TaxID=2302936 RepID=UPI0013D3F099|nr:hypothetical protein [Bacteroides sp. 224]NDV66958.1 hypothetical protein [Bacteroides sp. 224]
MQHHLKILLYLFILSLGACHPSKPALHKDIKLASSIIEEHPDTALYVLEKISNPEVLQEEEYAMYCLLHTEAQELTGKVHTSDSMINVAVHYFSQTTNDSVRGKTYFYSARVQEDLGNYSLAEQHYLLAIAAIEKTDAYKQASTIYNKLSAFYLKQERYEEAYHTQQKAYNNDLLAGSKENHQPWYILGIAILVIIASLFILLRNQNSLKVKEKQIKKQEKQLNTTQQTVSDQKLELTLLKKELRNMQQYIYSSSEVIKKIRQINSLTPTAKEKPNITEQEWNNFLNILEETYKFVSRLKQSYPKLTDIDIRICALLKEQKPTTHISTVMNMIPDTLARRMQRIKSEKMNLSGSGNSLEMIIRGI